MLKRLIDEASPVPLENVITLNDIDDELHFLCKCPCFDDLRCTYIKRYFYTKTNMYKLIELLKCDDRSTLIKLCKFIKLAFNRRNAIVNRG